MSNLKNKIRNEVREKSKDMDEGNLNKWVESMLSEIETLEIKCGEVNCILIQRERKFLKHIIKQNQK